MLKWDIWTICPLRSLFLSASPLRSCIMQSPLNVTKMWCNQVWVADPRIFTFSKYTSSKFDSIRQLCRIRIWKQKLKVAPGCIFHKLHAKLKKKKKKRQTLSCKVTNDRGKPLRGKHWIYNKQNFSRETIKLWNCVSEHNNLQTCLPKGSGSNNYQYNYFLMITKRPRKQTSEQKLQANQKQPVQVLFFLFYMDEHETQTINNTKLIVVFHKVPFWTLRNTTPLKMHRIYL